MENKVTVEDVVEAVGDVLGVAPEKIGGEMTSATVNAVKKAVAVQKTKEDNCAAEERQFRIFKSWDGVIK